MKIYDYNGKKKICGERVHEARRKMRLTQNDLTARLQIAGIMIERNSVSRIEIGTRFMTDYELRVLSKIRNVSVGWLLGIDGSKELLKPGSYALKLKSKSKSGRLSVLSLTENTLTKFALWASEVIFDSEVHFVSEVSPDGEVMGKLNFTCALHSLAVPQTSLRSNFTFAIAKTSQSRKRDNISATNRFVISFFCIRVWA